MEPVNSTKNSSAPALSEATAPYRTGPVSALDLEFPDWSGQLRPAPRATVEEMHKLSESLLRRLALQSSFDERRLKAKVSAEFSL
jgi:hypothetical protein